MGAVTGIVRSCPVLSAIVLLTLAACTTTPKGSFCSLSDPVRLSPEIIDQLSDAEVERLLGHNRKGAALCGWKQ